MTDYIAAGTRSVCPQCNHLLLFHRAIPQDSLPVIIACSFCEYRLHVPAGGEPPTFPKVDPVNKVTGEWHVTLSEAKKVDDKRWSDSAVQTSVRERCNAIATHLAGGLQNIKALQDDLERFAQAVTLQFATEWGFHSSFSRLWHPQRIDNWIRQPFGVIPVQCDDQIVASRTRLFIHPHFFTPEVGLPLATLGGFHFQFISPYLLIGFPLETWLQGLCNITSVPELKVVDDRIVGRDLFFCWRDIPGTVPAPDHHDDAPLIAIKDSTLARTWLVKMGIDPWNIGQLTEDHAFKGLWGYYQSQGVKAWHKPYFEEFVEHGRLALFFRNPMDAWELALNIGTWLFGQKLVLFSNLDGKDKYRALVKEIKANSTFHWKQIKTAEDLLQLDLQDVQFMIVEYDDQFPTEALEALHNYKGRLIMISQDMVMDTLQSNWQASRFFACISRSLWHPRLPGVETPFEYNRGQDSLITGLLAEWSGKAN